ncbi:glycolipid anchored surface protein [Xylariaceae sp. FL0016]|nr:glycolipid anchored surface protein [Xylariaceae sp. FL0016]
MAVTIEPVTIRGRYFWKGDERFLIKGVVYQQYRLKGGTLSTRDSLADEHLDDLKRSIPLLKEAGVNTLFVYSIDETKQHDTAMALLAEEGIYVLASMSNPSRCINRESPFASYTAELLQGSFRVLDTMAAYSNTLGIIVANEVINSVPTTSAAPVIRAVARDAKRYMAMAAKTTGQRVLPLGISTADTKSIQREQYEYFCSGPEEQALDFFSFNNYSWAGKSNFSWSGYEITVQRFQDCSVPVFFSEYGANTVQPRMFLETSCIFSQQMTAVFSGGIAYEFYYGPNQYGLVQKNHDGSLERLADFNNFRDRLRTCNEEPAMISEAEAAGLQRPSMPEPNGHSWRVDSPVPESPLDWKEIQMQIEDSDWIDVEREI